jgi:two-component system sensor histidine kinase BaeS
LQLFGGLYARLTAQALLAAALPGALLVWNLGRGHDSYVAEQDHHALAGLSTLVATEMRTGTPLSGALTAAQHDFHDGQTSGDPVAPLIDRVALYTPAGARIEGATPDTGRVHDERPVKLNGATVALLRIVRAPTTDGAGYSFMRDQIVGIVAAMAAILLILLVAGYNLAAAWTRPQRALYRASRAIAQGDYDADVSEEGPAETRATMRNLGRIARSFDRLETARRTWLVNVSEELRKPVQLLGDKLIALHESSPVDDQVAFEDIIGDVQRLSEMAEDLHAVAMADLGRLPVTFATVDPVALIHNAIWTSKRRAEAQRVTLEPGQLPPTTVPVKWDGARIEQLFTALIENSLRYTPAGGRIALGLEGQRGAWRLIVDDSAPGVDVDLARELFEPFYRTSLSPGESVTTYGLGLATAQSIVEAHHGRIEASPSPLGGLRVTVILPSGPPTA